ncbi:hypothetical protein HKX48_005156 [Thoreauomyces humboldtii]|nr:hypothetical protein HKX48_005156 [Thoreauomyces humboldtii]
MTNKFPHRGLFKRKLNRKTKLKEADLFPHSLHLSESLNESPTVMGAENSKPAGATDPTNTTASPTSITSDASAPKEKCKPCCACPETRKVRDECVINNGEEKCADLIKAHQDCMRAQGFNI